MFKHYLVVACLHFRRSPLAASINVFTLALGLVCFILALSVAEFWSHADRQFANTGRTFAITSEYSLNDGSGMSSGVALPLTNDHIGPYLKADFPQIQAMARVTMLGEAAPVRAGERTVRMRAFSADPEFLDIFFDLPFIEGDSRTALTVPHSVILTKEAAQKLYGTTHVIGKSITLYKNIDCTVTGVIDRIPDPSEMGHSAAAPLRFDILASRDVDESLVRARNGGRDSTQLPEDWLNGWNTTYVLLPRDGSFTADMLRRQLRAFVARHVPEVQRRRFHITLGVVPVSRLLGMAVRDALFPRQSAVSVPLLLLVLGAIVLAVACINFANLATARAAGRAREVGVRKAIGARPRQVILQYLFEAGMATAAALAVALALLALAMPVLEHAAGIDLRFLWSAEFVGWGAASLLALGAAVSFAAGFYPAFVLSRLEPALAVRAGPARTGPRSLAALLVGVQFALAAFLLIAVTIVHCQNARLKHAEREMAAAPLLVIENPTEITRLPQDTLRQELLRLPQVKSATAMEVVPWSNVFRRMPLSSSPSASSVQRTALVYVVGDDFFKTFDIPLLAGRVFDPKRADDVEVVRPNPTRTQNIVISRRLARELSFKTPSAAVGRMIYIPMSLTGEAHARPYRIIGVVDNKSLTIASRYGSRPNVYLFNPALRFHIVRLAKQDVGGALGAIDVLWKRLVPSVAIDRRFLTDYFNERYASFARINQAFTALAVIAWAISMIGLYAMAIMMSGRRLHEIAVRKTLGAHRGQMVRMLLRSFTTPVLIANVIAWPFAYVAGRAYLNVFIDPIPLTPAPFVIALVVSLLISWIAVGGQTWQAASAAPVQVMRHE